MNPSSPLPADHQDACNQLLARSAIEDPWSSSDYRDENARLLMAAMFRQREPLLDAFADVPVQDYAVFAASRGPSGGLTCGTLITLWHESPLCRGACPVCKGLALAVEFGGKEDEWMVVGVCQLCGYIVYREEEHDSLIAELTDALQNSPYTLPSPEQLLSTNGHAHTALLDALAACGEVMLPPRHCGFIAAMPGAMDAWPNPLYARAWNWAAYATVTHAPTDARVEPTQKLRTEVANIAFAHLMRTGRLSELDHEGEGDLTIAFPMISNERVSSPPARDDTGTAGDSAPDSLDAEDEALEEGQRDVNLLVRLRRARVDYRDVLARIQQRIENYDEWLLGDRFCTALSPDAMHSAFQRLNDREVCASLGVADDEPVTDEQRLSYFEDLVLPAMLEDADVTHAFSSVSVVATNGDALTLIASVHGNRLRGITVRWWGLAESAWVFRWALRRDGWTEDAQDFRELPQRRRLEIVTGVRGQLLKSA